ncbi:MFS transporter [Micromonospora sp. BRA006-A]|nr:MFS transporter [Micromonospora sp. BRA006-A]
MTGNGSAGASPDCGRRARCPRWERTATVAAPLYVASITDDPLVVSAGAAVSWLPWLLFALPGGVLADRVDRRRLMVLIDWVRVAALAVLAVAMLTDRAGIALLYAVLFVVNTGEVVFRTAAQAVLPAAVPRSCWNAPTAGWAAAPR